MTAAHREVYKPQYHFQIDARLLRDQINAEASTILWLLFGAQPLRILAYVMIDGAATAAIGIAAGGLVGWGLSRLAGNYVPELQLPGPIPLLGSAAVIIASAVLASLVPAARAARVDTVQALRAE